MNGKKSLIALAIAITTLDALAALPLPAGGDTASVERVAETTDLYTADDIETAFDAIESEFRTGFGGCELEELRYDARVESMHLDEILGHGKKGDGDLIVVLSEFTTDWRAADEGFSPNDRYEDWQWILTRPSQDAPWKIVDWGY